MVSQDLVDYITNQKAAGYTEDQLRAVILKSGYSQFDVDEAFKLSIDESKDSVLDLTEPSTLPQESLDSTPVDAFSDKGISFKKRSIGLCILYSIITFGIYSIFWYRNIARDVRTKTVVGPNPNDIWLIFIPFYGIYAMIMYDYVLGKAFKEEFSLDYLFILLLLLGPIGLIIAQVKLNEVAI